MHVIIKITISYKDYSTYPSLNLWTSMWTRQMWLSSFCRKRQLFSENSTMDQHIGVLSLFLLNHCLGTSSFWPWNSQFPPFLLSFPKTSDKNLVILAHNLHFFLCMGIMELFENYMESMDSSQNISRTHMKIDLLGITGNHTENLFIGSKSILIFTFRWS